MGKEPDEPTESLFKAFEMLNLAQELDKVVEEVLRGLLQLISFRQSRISFFDSNNHVFEATYNTNNNEIVITQSYDTASRSSHTRETEKGKDIYVLKPSEESIPDGGSLSEFSSSYRTSIPLICAGRVIGVIEIDTHREENILDAEHKGLIELFTSHAAVVLQCAVLRRDNTELLKELTRTKEH